MQPWILIALALNTIQIASAQHYLQRSSKKLSEIKTEFTTETAHYQPMFGIGDGDYELVEGVNRFGVLSLDPNGKSQSVDFGREELVYYVLEGSGRLLYNGNTDSITKDDFFYVPIHTNHGFASEDELVVLVMGYPIPEDVSVDNAKVQIANANQVEFQTLEQLNHGVTSRFRLLLGTTESTRDRLAVAYQINSLFVIDFDPAGTNVPHRHPEEEEIYFVLQGTGDMVAGETPKGKPKKHAAREGDAFYFSRNCLVGFYSTKNAKNPRARILAIRSKVP